MAEGRQKSDLGQLPRNDRVQSARAGMVEETGVRALYFKGARQHRISRVRPVSGELDRPDSAFVYGDDIREGTAHIDTDEFYHLYSVFTDWRRGDEMQRLSGDQVVATSTGRAPEVAMDNDEFPQASTDCE